MKFVIIDTKNRKSYSVIGRKFVTNEKETYYILQNNKNNPYGVRWIQPHEGTIFCSLLDFWPKNCKGEETDKQAHRYLSVREY